MHCNWNIFPIYCLVWNSLKMYICFPVRKIYDGSLSWQKHWCVRKLFLRLLSQHGIYTDFFLLTERAHFRISAKSHCPFNDNGVTNREKKTIKNNSPVLRIFKLFVQLKGDFCNRWGREVGDTVLRSTGNPSLSAQYTLVWCTKGSRTLLRFPLSFGDWMRKSLLSRSKGKERENKHFHPNNKMGTIGFMRGFLFCLEEKYGKQNSKGNELVIHNLELKES